MIKKSIATIAIAATAGFAFGQTLVSTDVTSDTTWSGEVVLTKPIFVKSGATLTIDPGTIIRGQPRTGPVVSGSQVGTPGALIVSQTGQIKADGTSSNPIIFTTAAVDNNGDNIPDDGDSDGFLDAWPGFVNGNSANGAETQANAAFYDNDPVNSPLAPLNAAGEANLSLWGGVVILGNAPTNLGNVAGLGLGKATVEGLTIPGFPVADCTYGGLVAHDNSGSLTYVSIRHAGDEIGEANELNGLTLAGVGDGTTVENIEIYCNFDDGIEWFGGTVNGKNLAVFFAGDDQFDQDQGYTGVNQYLFTIMNFFNENDGGSFGSGSGDKATEFDGEDLAESGNNATVRVDFSNTTSDDTPWPFCYAYNFNLTVLGSSPIGNIGKTEEFTPVSVASANSALRVRNGHGGAIWNALVVNTGTGKGVDVVNDSSATWTYDQATIVANGLFEIVQSTFGDCAAPSTTESTGALANGDLTNPGGLNKLSSAIELLQEDTTFNPVGDANNKLSASLKATNGPINPRPPTGLGGLDAGGVTTKFPAGVEKVTFRGAFSSTATTLWTTGWTALNKGGILAN